MKTVEQSFSQYINDILGRGVWENASDLNKERIKHAFYYGFKASSK